MLVESCSRSHIQRLRGLFADIRAPTQSSEGRVYAAEVSRAEGGPPSAGTSWRPLVSYAKCTYLDLPPRVLFSAAETRAFVLLLDRANTQ